MADKVELFKIKVKINGKSVKISYPLSTRTTVDYDSRPSTLISAVDAVKDIINKLNETK